jgi:hypothetical protein
VFLTACATQDKIMGQQVPDEQNIPLDQQMPPNNGQ